MAAIKGPAVFLAQFLRDVPPFNTLENICKWFADPGYAGVQIPGWDRRVIDIDQTATSNTYCD
ncbi:MAG TPA: sugar phosphate isomerase/epimerase, partial [Stellaceae bacterium]|nr:sugar phosphate isomerase/epimerase [Stellaceae bacterium]